MQIVHRDSDALDWPGRKEKGNGDYRSETRAAAVCETLTL